MTSKREDREALIEEAAKAILNEMGGIVPDELEQMHADAARAALAVFEQAHTEDVKRAQAKAWDEGFDEGVDDIGRAEAMRAYGEGLNPYD